MKIKNETPKNDFNATIGNTVLAVVLIMVWLGLFAIVGIIKAFITDVFWIRCLLVAPFSYCAVKATYAYWKHYS